MTIYAEQNYAIHYKSSHMRLIVTRAKACTTVKPKIKIKSVKCRIMFLILQHI